MGTSISKDKGVAKDAGMTADSIRKCCGAIAAWLKSRRSDHSEEALPKGDDTREKPGERTSSEEDEDTDTPKPEYVERALSNASSDIVGSNGVAPDDRVAATAHLKAALEALSKQDKDAFGRAINSLVKFGINIDHLAKTTLEWVNAHPWETAAIIIPLILLACTPAILGAVGFTAGGIAAGMPSKSLLRSKELLTSPRQCSCGHPSRDRQHYNWLEFCGPDERCYGRLWRHHRLRVGLGGADCGPCSIRGVEALARSSRWRRE